MSMRRPNRATASATRVGARNKATAIMSPGIPGPPSRSMIFGGVRAESQTFDAPPSVRS